MAAYVNIALILMTVIVWTSGERCSVCSLKRGVMDCSGLDLTEVPTLTHVCKLRSKVLNLNYNHFTSLPDLSDYGWRKLSVIYLTGNPLDCGGVCSHRGIRIISTCRCCEYTYDFFCVIHIQSCLANLFECLPS